MTAQPRRIRFEVDERSLVPLEQRDAQGQQLITVTVVDPETKNILTCTIPKVPPVCPHCGRRGATYAF